MLRPTLLLSFLLCTAACSSSDSPLSSDKQDDLKKAVAAFRDIPAEMHGSLAAAALAEIEVERLPASLVKTLSSLSQNSPDMRAMVIAQGLAESLEALQTMCQGAGVNMMRAMAEQSADDKLSLIRQECKTDRFKLVSNPGPRTDAMQFLLAHVVLSHLQENGGASADEKLLIKYLATAQAPANPRDGR